MLHLLHFRKTIVGILVMLMTAPSYACTTAVISGKVTVDGRPLLWKNRDAPYRDNQVVFLDKGKYRCMAVVNAGKRDAVWMGVNEAGLCIENSLCRDLTDPAVKGPGNGGLMLRALQSCATVADFEKLLEQTNGKRSTNATYGVIDRDGGAMLFEASPTEFARWDANDPKDAPNGYVVRSNFALMDQGKREISNEDAAAIYSGNRYLRADQLMRQAISDGKISVKYLLQHCARDLADAKGQPICGSINGEIGPLMESIDTASTISRRTSVSAAVFQGVLPNEDPLLTTMWVMLGEPNFSVAVPCWVKAGEIAQPLIGDGKSPLCTAVRKLRQQNYTQPKDDGAEFLQGAGMQTIWKSTLDVESQLLDSVAKARITWQESPPTSQQLLELHQLSATQATECINGLTLVER